MWRYQPYYQSTLAGRVELAGVGVHSGKCARMVMLPARCNTGIVFRRCDEGAASVSIRADYRFVCATALCTVLGVNGQGSISTIEHVMAALFGLGIDNAVIEVDGPEMPIMDGSAELFVEAINHVGRVSQERERNYIKILKPLRIKRDDQLGELLPHDGFALDVEIDFDCEPIGRQRVKLELTPDSFTREISRARTFGFLQDVERLWAGGYALGSSLDNSVAIDQGRVMNPEGLRFPDEFVRHKALDAIGDLALAGAPILGRFRSRRGGHRLNYDVVKALMSNEQAWCWTSLAPRRDVQGEAAVGLAAAFGPNIL